MAIASSIPASEAVFIFQTNDAGNVTLVCTYRAGQEPSGLFEECTAGAYSTEWLNGDPSETPEGVYILLEVAGFAEPAVRVEALEQFAQVQGCDWARLMLLTLEQSDA